MDLNTYIRYFFLFTLTGLSACKRESIPETGEVKGHVIEYKVIYLNDKAGSIPTSVLPGKMTLVFADHFAINTIEGFLGQFSLSFIADLKTKTVTNLLKVFDRKYVYYGKPGEIPICVAPVDSLTIRETDNTVSLAGFNCKKLIISSAGDEDFIVLSTDSIKVKNPNITTPYRDIDEVLLLFNTSLSLLKMQMIAVSHEEKNIPWKIFHVPEEYKSISKTDMEKVIRELFR